MKVSETDPRSVRTRHLLQAVLIQMSAEKRFASLTIQEVTQLAGLNRTTFYLHYSGLHELLEDCTRELFGQMRADIYANKIPDIQNDPTALVPFVESVFRHLEQHEKFYRAMLGKQGDPLFRGLFQELLAELIFESILTHAPGKNASAHFELIMRFFSAGFTGIAAWWLEKGKPISVEQASLRVAQDILPDYLRLMNRITQP